jgi:hypothetical protein
VRQAPVHGSEHRPLTVAVDWSGAKKGAARRIWLAEVRRGELVRLESGRDRDALADHLVEIAERDSDLVVGLDFAFSFPEWYVRREAGGSVRRLWERAAEQGDEWLATMPWPFWGRPGSIKPDLDEARLLRRTEREAPSIGGTRPKSAFQAYGPGAVGAGSVRGMPVLARLAEAGFAIWPFEAARPPCVVEIYPRLLTGDVVKSDPDARRAWVERADLGVPDEAREAMRASEDAFDAAVSAITMDRHRNGIVGLEPATNEADRVEGWIWRPEEGERGGSVG